MAGPDPELTVEAAPDPQVAALLGERLYEFGAATTGIVDGALLSVLLRGADGAVVGGAHGWTWGDACHVRYLYLPPEMRGRGLGARIMAAIEREAVARGCVQIVLETHDFQAPGFYAKLGFASAGVIEDYPRGHRYFLMRKAIGP